MPLVILHHLLDVFVQFANKRELKNKNKNNNNNNNNNNRMMMMIIEIMLCNRLTFEINTNIILLRFN
jgi:hypothetical protein